MTLNGERRYPGARSFEDSEIDRRLFFGRDRECKDLLDAIISETLTVVYAKSGTGKTSLLNAGIKEPLRHHNYLPLVVRLNDVGAGPVNSLLASLEQSLPSGIEYRRGDTHSLWRFFKTTEFWRDDMLLVPVLIIDQCEELFTLHSSASREQFIEQLAMLLRGNRSAVATDGLSEPILSESPPVVKIVLSIREDFLSVLEDLAVSIPNILNHRFRLGALDRVEARRAIEQPSKVVDKRLQTPRFSFDSDSTSQILDFLSAAGRRDTISAAAIEPFQLQLICQYVEDLIAARRIEQNTQTEMTISFADLGGASGLTKMIREFYDRQLDELRSRRVRGRVERMCERGLVNGEGRRLSLEEGEIGRRFKVTHETLAGLVRVRLLQAGPRTGSTYYELSHDTLVEPVRARRQVRARVRARGLAAILAGTALASGVVAFRAWAGDRTEHTLEEEAARARDLLPNDPARALAAAIAIVGAGLDAGRVPAKASTLLTDGSMVPTPVQVEIDGTPVATGPFVLGASGRLIAVTTPRGVAVCDRAGRVIRELKARQPQAVAVSDDGGQIAIAEGDAISVTNILGDRTLPVSRLPAPVRTLAFTADADLLTATTGTLLCLIHIAAAGADCRSLPETTGLIPAVVVSDGSDQKRLFALGGSGRLYRWNATDQTGSPTEISIGAAIDAWSASRDGRFVVSAANGKSTVWNRETRAVVTLTLPRPEARQREPAGAPGSSATLRRGNEPFHDWSRDLPRIAISDDGKWLAYADGPTRASVADLTAPIPAWRPIVLDGPGVAIALAWDPPGGHLAIATSSAVTVVSMSQPILGAEDPLNSASSPLATSTALKLAIPQATRSLTAIAFVGERELLVGGNDPDVLDFKLDFNTGKSVYSTIVRADTSPTSWIQQISADPSVGDFALLTDEHTLEVWNKDEKAPKFRTDSFGSVVAIRGRTRSVWVADKMGIAAWAYDTKHQSRVWAYDSKRSGELSQAGLRSALLRALSERGGVLSGSAQVALMVGSLDGGGLTFALSDGQLREARPNRPVLSLGDIARTTITAIASAGRELIVGADNGRVYRVKVYTDTLLAADGEAGHATSVQALATTRDGLYFASLGMDRSAVLWSITAEGSTRLLGWTLSPRPSTSDSVIGSLAAHVKLALSADHTELTALTGPRTLVHTTLPVPQAPAELDADLVVMDQSNRIVVTLNRELHKITIFDKDVRVPLFWAVNIGHRCHPSAVAVAPSGRAIVVGCQEGRLAMITPAGEGLAPPKAIFRSNAIPDASDTERDDFSTQNVPGSGPVPEAITAIAFEAGGEYFAAGSDSGRVALWNGNGDVLSGPIEVKTGDRTPVTAIAASATTLAAGTAGGRIALWNVRDPLQPKQMGESALEENRAYSVTSVAFSPDGSHLAVGAADGMLRRYAVRGGATAVKMLRVGAQDSQVSSIAFTPDGSRLVVGDSAGGVQVWSSNGEAQTGRIVTATGQSVAAAFDGSGRTLVVSRASSLGPIVPVQLTSWLRLGCERLRYARHTSSGASRYDQATWQACDRYAWADATEGIVGADASDGVFNALRRSLFHRTSSPLTLLSRAAAAGELAVVDAVIKSATVDVNAVGEDGDTPLNVALRGGNADVATLLLSAGSDPSRSDGLGATALHAAAIGNVRTLIPKLVAAGGRIGAADRDGVTPLMLAASSGSGAVVKELLKNGAYIDATDRFGETALMYAAQFGNDDAARVLRDANADATKIGGSGGRNALQWARWYGRTDVAHFLESDSALVRPTFGFTPRFAVDEVPNDLRRIATDMALWQDGRRDSDSTSAIQTLKERVATDSDAECLLGVAYGVGFGVPVDMTIARLHLQNAADRGSDLGRTQYAVALLAGIGGAPNIPAGLGLARRAADAEHPVGLWLLGSLYNGDLNGVSGVNKSRADAARLFRRAIDRGSVAAGNALGLMDWVDAVPESELDSKAAKGIVELLRIAEARGDIFASYNLALWFISNREFASGVSQLERSLKNERRQIVFIQRESPRSQSIYWMGMALRYGFARQSDVEANQWLQRSADMGNETAAVELGVGLEAGLGGTVTRGDLVRLWRSAASGGSYYGLQRRGLALSAWAQRHGAR
jgi:WD40 repeat protein/TPR repeat protein